MAKGPYSVVCGYGYRCGWRFEAPSPYVVIKRLRNHLEQVHETDCPICPWTAESAASLWQHIQAHAFRSERHTKKSDTRPIIYVCPDRDWKSEAKPLNLAYIDYVSHCRDRHGDGLACAFCGILFPGWGSLAYHVRTGCVEKPGTRVVHPLQNKPRREAGSTDDDSGIPF